MANRTAYENWDITGQAAKVLGIADQLKNAYKNDISDPANAKLDVDKQFAPSHLFFTDNDLYYSQTDLNAGSEYVREFIDYNPELAYRKTVKRTETGYHFPEIVKPEDAPNVGDKLVGKKQDYISIWQDESCELKDVHFRNVVDIEYFSYARHYLNSEDYFRSINQTFDALRKGNSIIDKLGVDYFLASVTGMWCYPYGNILYPFFTDKEDYIPDATFSKGSNDFFKKDGKVREHLKELAQAVSKYYVARHSYLTNLNTHEVIGQSLDMTVPEWNKKLADRGTSDKAKEYMQSVFLEKDSNQKYTKIAYSLRRQSLDALGANVESTVERMLTPDRRNGCGHQFDKDVKNQQAYTLQCRPENLLVFMHSNDLSDLEDMKGSITTGPFTESKPNIGKINQWRARGVRFYGLPFLIPSMAIVMDSICFRFVEYFSTAADMLHQYDLVKSVLTHSFKRPILYRKVACNVIELAKGQKFAAPQAGGSEILPFLIEAS